LGLVEWLWNQGELWVFGPVIRSEGQPDRHSDAGPCGSGFLCGRMVRTNGLWT
jgi:hypothetical protein